MATGDPVIVAGMPQLPSSSQASLAYRNGGSAVPELFEVWKFNDAAASYLDLFCVVSHRYTGGNLSVRIPWTATAATAGDVVWGVAFRRLNTTDDVDASHSYSYQSATATTAGTAGMPTYTTVAFTQAQADGIAAGEMCVLRIRRDGGNAADTMAGDAELWAALVTAVEA